MQRLSLAQLEVGVELLHPGGSENHGVPVIAVQERVVVDPPEGSPGDSDLLSGMMLGQQFLILRIKTSS